MRKPIAIGIAAALVAALAGVTPAQAHDSRNGDSDHRHGHDKAVLTVFNGITDRTVDVYIDGKLKFDDVEPGEFENSVKVRGGEHDLAVTRSNARNARHAIVKLYDADFDAGGNYTLAAHFDAHGDKTATLFENDTSSVKRYSGRLTVRHVAEARAVDVRADGSTIISHLRNSEEAVETLWADTYEVKVTKAGKKRTLIGPVDVEVERRTNTIVYAWGERGDLDLAIQMVDLDRRHHRW